jgi:hypothetical protein
MVHGVEDGIEVGCDVAVPVAMGGVVAVAAGVWLDICVALGDAVLLVTAEAEAEAVAVAIGVTVRVDVTLGGADVGVAEACKGVGVAP